MWAIWQDRKCRIYEKKVTSGKMIARFTIGYIKELDDLEIRRLPIPISESVW